jgi:hypothetical protein
VIFTHCDQATGSKPVDEAFIKKKLASIKKYCGLDVPLDNVVLFDNDVDSLKDFVDEFVKGEINISEDIEERLEEFDDNLHEAASQIDQIEKQNLIRQLEIMHELLNEQREQKFYIQVNRRYLDDDEDDVNTEPTESNSDDKPAKREPKPRAAKKPVDLNESTRKENYKPSRHCDRRKDGELDKRTKTYKDQQKSISSASSSVKAPTTQEETKSSGRWKPSEHGGLKKDGTPDLRCSAPANPFVAPKQVIVVKAPVAQVSSSMYSGPTTKAGAPDMRTSQAKAYVAALNTSTSLSSSSYSGYTGKLTASGNPDMRTSAAKAYVAAQPSYSSSSYKAPSNSSYTAPSYSSYTAPSSSYGGGGGLSGYTGRVTASGAPDMRTTAGKAWAASNK